MLVNRILRAAFTKFNRIKYEVEEKGKTSKLVRQDISKY